MVVPSQPPRVLAVVPARGGSKSIPRKNIKLLAGVPLIAYSIAAGLQAKRVNRVIVSTDDEEIAEVARAWGAEIPFMRPAEFAQDDTLDLPVFQHALHWLEENEHYVPDAVVQLRPTSPFRPLTCVDDAIEILLGDPQTDSVRGVVPSGQNPYKMWRLVADGTMRCLLDEGYVEPYNMPRQRLPPTYWQTGHIDVIRPHVITQQGMMSGQRIRPYMLDPRFTIDIDTLLDWERAEWMLARLDLPMVRPARPRRLLPAEVRMLALDFDGVLTDNRVWVDGDGSEWVACNRGDGLGISLAKKAGIEVLVISREADPVVAARCGKLGIDCYQGVLDKEAVLKQLVVERGLAWSGVVFVGNDVTDLACMRLAGCGVAVADAHPDVLAEADVTLKLRGGHGAVREICDQILNGTRRE